MSSRIVALDGSSSQCSVALDDIDYLLVGKVYDNLLNEMDEILAKKMLSWLEIDSILLTVGPGSFTNIRLLASIVNAIKSVYGHLKIFVISSVFPMNDCNELAIQMTKNSLVRVCISDDINYEVVDSYDGFIFDVSKPNDKNLARVVLELFKNKKSLFQEVDFVYNLDYCGEVFAYKKKNEESKKN